MNPGQSYGYFFSVGVDVLNATLNSKTGTIVLQTGDAVHGTVDSQHVELWQPAGFASMPAPPTTAANTAQGGAQGQPSCQAIVHKRSDYDVALCFRDLRATGIYGNLQSGESCAYATVGQARTVYKADGSITHLTTDDNTANGNTVFSRTTPTEERFFSPFGTRWHDQTGFHLRTWQGAKMDLGGAGLPAPFSAFGSMAHLTADIVQIDGAVTQIGRDNGTSGAVVQALPLAAIMASLATAITSLNAAIVATNAAAATATGYGLSGAAAAAAAALTAAATAVTTASTALGTVGLPAATGAGCATNTTVA